jgi:hypothetical protein
MILQAEGINNTLPLSTEGIAAIKQFHFGPHPKSCHMWVGEVNPSSGYYFNLLYSNLNIGVWRVGNTNIDIITGSPHRSGGDLCLAELPEH